MRFEGIKSQHKGISPFNSLFRDRFYKNILNSEFNSRKASRRNRSFYSQPIPLPVEEEHPTREEEVELIKTRLDRFSLMEDRNEFGSRRSKRYRSLEARKRTYRGTAPINFETLALEN